MNRNIFNELNNLERFMPIFVKEEIIIDNIDKEYLLQNVMNITLYANEMAYNILSMCTGENSIADIIDTINELYEISKEEVKIDVLEILHMAWIKHFLKWKDRNVFEFLYEKMYMDEMIFSRVFLDRIKDVVDNGDGITNSEINKKMWYKPQTIQNIYNNEEEFCYCIKKNGRVLGGITIYPEIERDQKESYISKFIINYISMRRVEERVWESFIQWCVFNFVQTENYEARSNRVFLEMETSLEDLIVQEMIRLEFRDATMDKKSNYKFWDKEVVFL